MLQDLGHGLPRLLDPLDVAGVHHEHHAVRLRVVVLPDAPDPLPAAQVEDGHLELALLQVDLGEAHCGRHVLRIVCEKKKGRRSKEKSLKPCQQRRCRVVVFFFLNVSAVMKYECSRQFDVKYT